MTAKQRVIEASDDALIGANREGMQKAAVDSSELFALYQDTGVMIILLAVGAVERLERAFLLHEEKKRKRELSRDERYGLAALLRSYGEETYVPGITFIQAITALANQYKHFGEWQIKPRNAADAKRVEQLVGHKLQRDAASRFLIRCQFSDYQQFEDALLSCSKGLTHDSVVPDGRDGVSKVTINAPRTA